MNPLKHRRGVLAIAALALCVLGPSVVRGAESDTEKKQRAKEHYEIATRFYDVGKYGEAVKEYEEAYMLTGDAALLFNIGQAYRLWDRPEDAIRVYKNYLRQRPDAVNRTDVEKKIADLEKVVEERRRGGAPPGEAVSPPAPTAPTARVPPPGVVPAPIAPIEPPPMAEPGQPPAGVIVGESVPAAPAKPQRSWLSYSLLGVGGACLVTATIAGAVGASKAKKLQDASQNHEPFDPAVQQNGKTANGVAVVAGVAGLAIGGVGGYLLWRDHTAARAAVAVAPAFSPTFAGGSALLTF
jgi:tetratricopeptide (TPR) repeat protein